MFDAASRLAEGRPAADTVQNYVWACHLLGYQNPDLTQHASQVRDWYGSEDGIDLAVLEADCEALRTAAAAAEGALARQDAQLALMSAAWQGPGAEASRGFLRRHSEASAAVASAVLQAAESLASLRDRLWHSVDGKVAATGAAEARGARPDWRTAVQTVTGGAGDRATASELIDREVKPFVDKDIRAEWLTAMQSAIAAVTDAYDAAVDELTSEAAVAFDVPGELGPSWSPSPGDGVETTPAGLVGGGGAAPAGAVWSMPPAAQPMSAPLPPPPTAAPVPSPPLPAAPPVDPAAMAPPSAPSLGGGMPDIGSGLSGFGSQLGDMLGGLLGTSQDALSDLPEPGDLDAGEAPDELDDLDENKPEEDEDDLDEDDLDEDDEKEDEADGAETDPAAGVTGESEPAAPLSEPLPPVPTETPVAPPPVPAPLPPPPEPMSAAGTPCEIAANELPQVGE
ncbi:hypothetical protein AB4Z42_03885 [Mycobacterium sp. 2YAF39]|uniref:hypothetical protein n=1 Tax=Mycobacterium sp. 2YAF39 TaxID=3233033 RepID=UPI003F9A1373